MQQIMLQANFPKKKKKNLKKINVALHINIKIK